MVLLSSFVAIFVDGYDVRGPNPLVADTCVPGRMERGGSCIQLRFPSFLAAASISHFRRRFSRNHYPPPYLAFLCFPFSHVIR